MAATTAKLASTDVAEGDATTGSGLCPSDFWVPPCPLSANAAESRVGADKEHYRTGLRVNNSMFGGKVEFIPFRTGTDAKKVTWYGCGPTVYDAAHMGHARTYVAFDIIRRIMTEYFNYDVFMCMNITDIDDKIIARAIEQKKDFSLVARYWEAEFFKDMKALNVQLPDVITRVSEYVDEVLTFIKKIIDNGFGYESQGSVYFDTQAFRASKKHVYGRMEPFSVNDEARALEGEGALGVVTEKKTALDFALWKKSKEGEPSWESPWGPGRPGWHIECSAMASTVLGFPIDIHSGGIDLRFPHHDNELAQSEACFDKPQWVNYFLHSGHLHIKGSKMSKSLKNFITIKQALEAFSPRSIRLLTLMHRWDAPMNYSSDGDCMGACVELDKTFINFFASAATIMRSLSNLEEPMALLSKATSLSEVSLSGLLGIQSWNGSDVQFHEKIMQAQQTVHCALLDNFDTVTAVGALRTLVSDANTYANTYLMGTGWKAPLFIKAARYVFRILRLFGVTVGSEALLNYGQDVEGGDGSSIAASAEVIDCLAKFREKVRTSSQNLLSQLNGFAKAAATSDDIRSAVDVVKGLLTSCDSLRDEELVKIGIQLEDVPTGGSTWKIVSKEDVAREQERKKREEERKEAQKASLEAARKEAEEKKQRELQIEPKDFFRVTRADQFKEFDEEGLPTIDVEGNPVSKSQRDKLFKILAKHNAAREKLGST